MRHRKWGTGGGHGARLHTREHGGGWAPQGAKEKIPQIPYKMEEDCRLEKIDGLEEDMEKDYLQGLKAI